MKTYCKDIDITDPQQIVGAVSLCFYGKLCEPEFRNLLVEIGRADPDTLMQRISLENPAIFRHEYQIIAEEIAKRISERNLNLKPILYFWHRDGRQGKRRLLGKESAIHQCMDYVAVGALMPLFNAKIMSMQCASIPDRGQVYGKKLLEKAIQRDPEHNRVYIKTDIRQCYKSLLPEKVMELLRRDIHKNSTLLWFIEELLGMFKHGLSIGSYLSQWLCNYALSYGAHFLHEQCFKTRKHRDGTTERTRLFTHAVMYMDDLIITGTSKRDLKMCVRKYDKFLHDFLGLELKPGWCAKYPSKEPVDSMGFCVGSKATTIRGGIFLSARRWLLKADRALQSGRKITLRMAQDIICYHGWFKHSNSRHAIEKYRESYFHNISIAIISKEAKANVKQNMLCAAAGAA